MEQKYMGRRRQETPVLCHCDYDQDLPPGIRYGPLIRNVYVFECNKAGYGSVIINGRTFPVRPGDCYILLPGDTVTHTADYKEPRSGVWCSVDGLQVGWALEQAGITSENPYAPGELFQQLTEQVEALVQMRGDSDPGAQMRRTGYIYGFLGILLQNAAAKSGTDWLDRVIGHMETNYFKPISVAALAKEAYLERSYFSARFKAETGQSPHAYLTSLRIRKACALMTQTRCSVANAAELVGLDGRNFARLFKKETGMTPSQYLSANTDSE